MSSPRIVLLVALSLSGANVLAAPEVSPLTPEERSLLAAVARVDPNFRASDRARRHHAPHPESGQPVTVLSELVFQRQDGLFFGEFMSYNVSFAPYSNVVSYSFDAGSAFRGETTAMVNGDDVLVTERVCGTSGCSVSVMLNGQPVLER
ncbi:MAG: hypothetical protein H6983_03375 [Ectothiorhodospiraceae bacterium]|nr:hypothetical protein [Ectothiorhodospiraceae bacterium]